jgi:hypothetical protein
MRRRASSWEGKNKERGKREKGEGAKGQREKGQKGKREKGKKGKTITTFVSWLTVVLAWEIIN